MQYQTRHLFPKTLIFLAVILLGAIALRELTVGGKLAGVGELFRFVVVIAAGLLVVTACFVSYYEYHGFGSQEGIIRRGPHDPIVSITFDDGPNPTYTPQILDVLREKGVKATFFVLGRHVEKYPEVAERIVEEGHEVGNHTYSHRDLVPSTRTLVQKEVGRADQAIRSTMRVNTKLFRPPRGIYSQAVRRLLINEGYKIVLWTVSSTDWRRISSKKILRRIKIYSRAGAIILFHDSGSLLGGEGGTRSHTVEVLPMVIDYLREKRDYEIVPLSEMLERLEVEAKEELAEEA